MSPIGRALIVLGLVIVGVGVVLTLADKILWIGRLPGDIVVKRDNWSFYFPLTTSILISVVLSLILYLFRGR